VKRLIEEELLSWKDSGHRKPLVRSVATIAGGFVGGLFMDLMKHLYNGSDYAYRFIPLWSIFWSAIALFFLWRLYQDWKKLPVHDL
jgi:hypothetical protein